MKARNDGRHVVHVRNTNIIDGSNYTRKYTRRVGKKSVIFSLQQCQLREQCRPISLDDPKMLPTQRATFFIEFEKSFKN